MKLLKKSKKIIVIIISFFVLVVVLLRIFQRDLIAYAMTGNFGLYDKDEVVLPNKVKWFDDYYTVQYINENTIAIGEPRYWQENICYLILGETKAVLLDTGPGNRDILSVTESITNLPLIIIPSHMHFDHIGNFENYNEIWIAKNQIENEEITSNSFTPKKDNFLGWVEARKAPKITYSKLLNENDKIDLGNRSLTVLYTEGHTSNSISLFDKEANLVFTGDFFYKGTLLASNEMPTSSLSTYQKSLKALQTMTDDSTLFYGGHTTKWRTPELTKDDLNKLTKFINGKTSNNTPKEEVINENITISF